MRKYLAAVRAPDSTDVVNIEVAARSQREAECKVRFIAFNHFDEGEYDLLQVARLKKSGRPVSVSYTHLTLPTKA